MAIRSCMPAISSVLSTQGLSGVAAVVSHVLKSGFSPVRKNAAERSAASITPPVRPKMVPAPVEVPSGSSNFCSGSAAQSTLNMRSMRSNSRVVSTTSTS